MNFGARISVPGFRNLESSVATAHRPTFEVSKAWHSSSQRFNRSRKRTGALWQSRYHAKSINQQDYLDRVILYIHLNPVAGGLVDRPADHVFGGHREIVKGVSNPVIDVDDCLLSFGQTQGEARTAYLSAIRLGCRELGKETEGEARSLRTWFQPDRDLAPDDTGPYIDVLGRSTGPERRELSAEEFIERSASLLHIDLADLVSRSRKHNVVEARRLVVTLGRERWGQSTKGLAFALQKSADTVTYIQREGIRERLEDQMFLRRYEDLDAGLIDCGQ